MGRLAGQTCAIIGAGIAGLALARALALRGAQVNVYEQAPQIREVGAGIQIAPNGAAVLRSLGLGDDLNRHGLRAAAIHLHDGHSANVVLKMDLTQRSQDRDYHFLHRADLIDLLHKGAAMLGVQIHLDAAVSRLDLSGDAPLLHLQNGPAQADLVFGADGLHSAVRAALCGADQAFFTGQVAWRAVIAGDGGPDHVQVFMGAGRHLVSYPLRGGTLRNLVCVRESRSFSKDSWSSIGDAAQLRAAFADFCPAVQKWLHSVQDLGEWGLYRRPMAPRWGQVLPKGAAFILGDAAHPTLPFLAQGASMALEDVAILAALLDALPPDLALQTYQAMRAPRVARILAAANQNARNYHLRGPARHLAHMGLRAINAAAPNMMLRRFDWLYGYNAPLAAQQAVLA